MEKITEHFNREEFDCHDGAVVPQRFHKNLKELCNNLEILRNYLGKPIHITSGYRTESWNKKNGGALLSQHLNAKAADIKVPGTDPASLAAAINFLIADGKMKEGGIGLYQSWVHYDIRGTKARWDLR